MHQNVDIDDSKSCKNDKIPPNWIHTNHKIWNSEAHNCSTWTVSGDHMTETWGAGWAKITSCCLCNIKNDLDISHTKCNATETQFGIILNITYYTVSLRGRRQTARGAWGEMLKVAPDAEKAKIIKFITFTAKDFRQSTVVKRQGLFELWDAQDAVIPSLPDIIRRVWLVFGKKNNTEDLYSKKLKFNIH